MQRSVSTSVLLLLFAGSQWAQIVSAPSAGQGPAPPPSNVRPEERCVVAGRVTNALTGEPLRKATVLLSAGRAGNGAAGVTTMSNGRSVVPSGQGYSTSTDNDGSFRIEGVNPGTYRLS